MDEKSMSPVNWLHFCWRCKGLSFLHGLPVLTASPWESMKYQGWAGPKGWGCSDGPVAPWWWDMEKLSAFLSTLATSMGQHVGGEVLILAVNNLWLSLWKGDREIMGNTFEYTVSVVMMLKCFFLKHYKLEMLVHSPGGTLRSFESQGSSRGS